MRNAKIDNELGNHLWTVRDVAAFLKIHPKTIYEWVARGEMPFLRIGNRIRFNPSDILRWLRHQKEG
jgi:excisionase family DNA binding protein